MCWQPPRPQAYIGGGEGAAPPLGFPPQGWRQPPNPSRVRPRGGEGGATRVGLKAHLDLGFAPSHSPMRLGPLLGGAPAHLGLVPSHTWPMLPSRDGGPTWWTPGTLPVVPVRYR